MVNIPEWIYADGEYIWDSSDDTISVLTDKGVDVFSYDRGTGSIKYLGSY